MVVLTNTPHRMHNAHFKVPGREFLYALVNTDDTKATATGKKSTGGSRVNGYPCVTMANTCTAWDAKVVVDAGDTSDPTGSDVNFDLEIRNEYAFLEFRRENVIQFCFVSFDLLSALFQGIPGVLCVCNNSWFQAYMHKTIGLNGAQKLRYIE